MFFVGNDVDLGKKISQGRKGIQSHKAISPLKGSKVHCCGGGLRHLYTYHSLYILIFNNPQI